MDNENSAVGCGLLILAVIALSVLYWVIGWTTIFIAHNQLWLYSVAGISSSTSIFKVLQGKKLLRRLNQVKALDQEISRRWR